MRNCSFHSHRSDKIKSSASYSSVGWISLKKSTRWCRLCSNCFIHQQIFLSRLIVCLLSVCGIYCSKAVCLLKIGSVCAMATSTCRHLQKYSFFEITKHIYFLQSTTVYVPSSELGLSHPLSRQRVCPFPPEPGGGGILACGWGVGGIPIPIPTIGEKLSTLPTLCSECILQFVLCIKATFEVVANYNFLSSSWRVGHPPPIASFLRIKTAAVTALNIWLRLVTQL
jgi:hypothetical protein